MTLVNDCLNCLLTLPVLDIFFVLTDGNRVQLSSGFQDSVSREGSPIAEQL